MYMFVYTGMHMGCMYMWVVSMLYAHVGGACVGVHVCVSVRECVCGSEDGLLLYVFPSCYYSLSTLHFETEAQ